MKRPVFLLSLALLALVIFFESAQQLFYLRRYNFVEDPQFFDVLKRQSFRWLIWAVMAIVLLLAVRRIIKQELNYRQRFLKYALLIAGLVLLDVFLIAIFEYDWSAEGLNWSLLFGEYAVFFLFQKAPFFTLGYIGLSWIFFLYLENQDLQVEVKKLADLQLENEDLYQQLAAGRQQEQVLTLKSGGKYQVVPLQDIEYIEADDYCVNIYLQDGKKYVMRISLKALEEKLPVSFIRIHRKFIAHQIYVAAFDLEQQVLLMKSQTRLSISKSRLKTVRAHFGNEKLH